MVAEKIAELKARITTICKRLGRDAEEVLLVLVTKQVSAETIRLAYDAGMRAFGENRVQELLSKKDLLPPDVKWHLIGHLQTNKVKDCIKYVTMIHSLDSLKLADEIEKQAGKKNLTIDCLVQVNTSGEASKFGVPPEALESLIHSVLNHSHIRLKGLMTIGPLTKEEAAIRASFKTLKSLQTRMQNRFPALKWNYLSMGMSQDFEWALEEGSNCLRIGTAVFGERVV
ncbi:MAG: YggS family pyridoxal phosphate-dependent enzyme [Candidatus Omnitrophica bacterium CG11_big_fil_rev_8_21_14_0_20_45_26]|uniref:Pyridoxal phosphate homeostasis protein n=1 Tax=Candidatus Abzuiibacterium crystallinum TaxID=1974748 RepID=A0A2H0LPW7_9BACT|nr:MAG: YggS family pyridoxal phosphate-dependent enzyme [Candidatus Omnitrophica bacterium CG11_big_fil_rev_8_21_14_0_20_45_26]PIW64181.1 MAG: YggS family pyridoxal phosphate-dependent enzyme [Candidatus Omnitrophica bacterium CG12_big_fil_rev_8_21_14_0_65_45_16]